MAGYKRRSVVGMGALGGVVLALSGCAVPVENGRRRLSSTTQTSDGRFAEFTDYVPEKLEIRTDLGPLQRRMPGIGISSAHWVSQYQQEEREVMPYPDRPLWVNAVLTLDPEATRAFDEASSGKANPLPGIYPDLRQYVPKSGAFTTVPKEKANEILDVEHMIQDDPSTTDGDQFGTDQVAVCAESSLLILIATEHHM